MEQERMIQLQEQNKNPTQNVTQPLTTQSQEGNQHPLP